MLSSRAAWVGAFCVSWWVASAAFAQAPASAPASAASASVTGRPQGPRVPRDDVAFLQDAARAGLAELEAGKLAVDKGRNTQVKGFAQQMLDEHTKAQEELAAFAQSKNVNLPREPSLGQRAKLKLLAGAKDVDFDRRYARGMGVDAHRDAMKLYQRAASRARDADVRAFAAKALPMLQHHLQMAQELRTVVDKETAPPARAASS